MNIVDLFCGCGGLSLGAHYAGFNTALAVDVDNDLRSAYRRNFGVGNAEKLDLAKTKAATLKRKSGPERPVGVIGGPPCQGFSVMGRSIDDDPRNNLAVRFIELTAALGPKFFVMENVPGILAPRHKSTVDAVLSSIPDHYEVLGPIKLNAADFGAATSRERVLIVGFNPSEMDALSVADFDRVKLPSTSVREAIHDLPSPSAGVRKDGGYDWVKYTTEPKSAYARKMRTPPPRGYLPEYARQLFAKGYVTGLQPTEHTAKTIERFSETLPGKQESVSRYQRLSWEGIAPTLRAGTGSDKGSYQAARPIHPREPRVISIREAARLQGFPDWFLFHPTKWHSHRMIGNSVSPIFSEAIFSVIASKLDSKNALPLAAE
ncbi:DNA (cytosine-5-)-methyltransferase [Maricaulis maris MCS10]|uniref:DNA (cytosine-5-)-methyltransferase n=1 Tax=Maricaulis maris (strain MCS10) TaxID=394221 RepID=Q0AMN2_MARMM|nr:DNA cytosine methyltransferase [Maricaulis maris]ABI66455.1 DNA (cytosine-5-)-methyltransferase [Maricaulis maris MCS10]